MESEDLTKDTDSARVIAVFGWLVVCQCVCALASHCCCGWVRGRGREQATCGAIVVGIAAAAPAAAIVHVIGMEGLGGEMARE